MDGVAFNGTLAFGEKMVPNAGESYTLIDWTTTTTTLAQLKAFLLTYAKNGMHAHNKIMSPAFDKDKPIEHDTNAMPQQLTRDAYKMFEKVFGYV